jgi:hypothetical protein
LPFERGFLLLGCGQSVVCVIPPLNIARPLVQEGRHLRGGTDGGGADHGVVIANGWVVADDGHIAGPITLHAVKEVRRGYWPKTTVAEAMHALALTGATVCRCGSRGKHHDGSGPLPASAATCSIAGTGE